MQKRTLGKSHLEVSALGLGCMRMTFGDKPIGDKPWIVPIPGSRKIERLQENIGAVHVDLSEGDLREIEGAISQITILGDRY